MIGTGLWQDITYGARSLMRSPGFTVAALLSIAIGVGANTAIFSIVRGILFRPLPFAEAESLVLLESEHAARNDADLITYHDVEQWQEVSEAFSGFAASAHWGHALQTDGPSVELRSMLVSANLFDVLGARPYLGRLLRPEDGQPGNSAVVVLSHSTWSQLFGSDSSLVGTAITLNGSPHTVVGITPPGFLFPDEERQVWLPLDLEQYGLEKAARMFPVVGRLREGYTLDQGLSELTALSSQLAEIYPKTHDGWTIVGTRMLDSVVGESRGVLLLLQAAVGFVLLIVCVNVANLVLARTTARQHDLAVRTAIGAGRQRIAQQLLAESLLLSLTGGALGIALAYGALGPLLAAAPVALPRMDQIAVDGAVLAFGIGATVLTGLLFGAFPAFGMSRADPADALKDASLRLGDGHRGRFRSSLVVTEHAMAIVLLVAAGLLVRSFMQLQRVDPGFARDNVVTAQVFLQEDQYPDTPSHLTYFETAMERLRSMPSVAAVGATSALPMHPVSISFDLPVRPQGQETVDPDNLPRTGFRIVTPGYLEALGVPLVAGRDFDQTDREDSRPVVMINQAAARQFWPDRDPIGRTVRYAFRGAKTAEVVGVVGNVLHQDLRTGIEPELYAPFRQAPICGCLTIVARTVSGQAAPSVQSIQNQLLAIDPAQPAYRIDTMDQLLRGQVSTERFMVTLLTLFAAVALGLAGVGIYGVVAYAVSRRTREIGIRTALGADRRRVVGMVLKQGLWLAGIGTAVGVAGSLVTTRALQSVLFEVGTVDIGVYGSIVGLSFAAALLASYLPARRAARVDPIDALRSQ